ncbi:MAG: hypothetical protein ACOYB1_09725 [Limnohabitans sp.]
MYYFEVEGVAVANADAPKWLEYLKDRYPFGTIVFKPLPAVSQPIVDGVQTL